MRTILKASKVLGCAALCALTAPALGANDAPEPAALATARYTVQFVIGEGDTIVGRPRLRVAAGTPTSMTMPGSDGYRMTITVNPARSAEGTLTARMTLDANGGGAIQAPEIAARPGEAKTVEFDRPATNGAARVPLTVKLVIL